MREWLDKIRSSLGLRLILLFLGAGVLVIAILALTFTLAARHRFDDNFRPHIREYQGFLLRELGMPPNIERARQLAGRLPLEIVIQGPQGEWSSTPRLRGLDLNPPVRRYLGRRSMFHVRGYRIFRPHVVAEYTIYFATPLKAESPKATWVLMLAIVLLLGLLLLVYLTIRRLFRPLDDIRGGLARIGNGDLAHPIDVHRKDELSLLAKSVNEMAQRIREMLNAKRELLLAISHELRSPLTRARIHSEMVDEPPRREALIRDLSAMESLIGEILESERLSDGHNSLLRSYVDSNQLTQEVLRESFQEVAIDRRLNGPKSFFLDATRFRLLVRNLLANALRHNRAEIGTVKLQLDKDPEGGLKLLVSDHGKGIPADRLEQITEPFFRLDPSRQRETGGVGLGLYLCRLVVEAHKGSMIINSEPDLGTEVIVQIPAQN